MNKSLLLIIFVLFSVNLYAAGSSSSSSKRSSSYSEAVDAVNAEDYSGAIKLLDEVVKADPKNADAWNYLGYSNRKQGQFDTAFEAYAKALSLKPKHKGALEYQGELFLQTDQLEKAEENLRKLDKACFFRCGELKDLEQAIKAYKSKKASG